MNIEKQILEILKDFETFKLTKDEQGVYAHTNSYKPFVERFKALILNSSSSQLRKESKSFLNIKTIADLQRLFPDQLSYGISCDKDLLHFFVNGKEVFTKALIV